MQQIQERGYNPPKRERILEWQEQQDFPICPNPDDPDACNVYRELGLPLYGGGQGFESPRLHFFL